MITIPMYNDVVLDFWIEVNAAQTVLTCWVKKHDDRSRSPEKYKVYSVSSIGECWRHSGLPVGWGFRLTTDHRIKEIR